MNTTINKIFNLFAFIVIFLTTSESFCAAQVIKNIIKEKNPNKITIFLSSNSPYRIIQIDKKEILTAFQNVTLAEDFKITGEADFIKNLSVDKLSNEVISFIINTKEDVKKINSAWKDNSLVIYFIGNDNKPKNNTKKEIEKSPAPQTTNTDQKDDILAKKEEQLSDKNDKKEIAQIDHLVSEMMKDPNCNDQQHILSALDFCKKNMWEDALIIINRFFQITGKDACLEKAHFLKAYSVLKANESGDIDKYLAAINLFKDANGLYPSSRYYPYGIANIGKIYALLKDYDEARAYLKLIIEKFKSYPGMSEVLYEQGKIYLYKNDNDNAITIFKNIISLYPEEPIIIDAKVELARAMYKKNNFNEALKLLSEVLKKEPNRAYKSPDFLVLIGNSFYQTENYEKAREYLTNAYNLFPKLENQDLVLTKIADTYLEQKQYDNAKKIYKLVAEKYKGKDGSLISLLRIADNFSQPSEKENIYDTIIWNYPDNPMSRLAMIKLAGLFHKDGRDEKAIALLKDLILKGIDDLKKEAYYLLGESYNSLFQDHLKKGNYLNIISNYEKDKKLFYYFENPDIFFLVGNAYFNVEVFPNAADNFKKAYELYEKDKIPESLIFNLGVSLHESGKIDDAVKTIKDYIKLYPKGKKTVASLTRLGDIFFDKKEFNETISYYESAINKIKNNEDKSEVLFKIAKVYREMGDKAKNASTIENALNILVSAKDINFSTINKSYKELGQIYMEIPEYLKAADAFEKAIKFAEKDKATDDMLFMEGEAYYKAKDFDKAYKIYTDIAALNDSMWATLAKEKIREMQLKEKANKYTKGI
ncbi:MAG: tetratricopeptide repeat protein [Desulfobacterales bacterium]|nr:tetratricopeptide repeat protein [Desulfobacterales bacterium]